MMSIDVSDKISNLPDQIANTARVLGRSAHRQKIFEVIYQGKTSVKTKSQIAKRTGLKEIRVLQEAAKLSANHIVETVKVEGESAYKKILFFSHHKDEILRLARSKKKLSEYATKVTPRTNVSVLVPLVKFPTKPFEVSQLTVDDIDSFKKVRKVKKVNSIKPIDEAFFKEGMKKILGDQGKFTDWGGERNDLFTTKVKIRGKRIGTAFAFKGKGTKGILRPRMMGKNGDQIQRLFEGNGELFVVQYWGQVDQSIYEQMNSFAIRKSATERKRIFYCAIDGTDTARILKAYRSHFKRGS